ncbi:hypothetical protein [Labrys monachus]|uniref:Uncharacterized protein n=1 Tax=Labrys monachus TaxID=217067 RepID=A0ABU0FKN2_9HYPH|nr:hypothetical protein [Labrys monachus]MDQ0395173.1 hypothetical protein [Labrys monachus]
MKAASIDPAIAAVDRYMTIRKAVEDQDLDEAAWTPLQALLSEQEEALAKTVPATRAGAEKMVEVLLLANDAFIGSETVGMCLRSLAAAVPI